MARIKSTISGTSSPIDYDEDGLDMDTADRARYGAEREVMREDRDAEMDARNQPRAETADYEWRRPTSLEAPPARPGMVQRWVRAEMRTEADNLNWTGKLREGWRPRSPSTIPECEAFYGVGQLGSQDVVRVGGLILMEMPEQRLASKRNAVREQIRRQEESVAMETAKISSEGVKQGFAPIVREERADVSTGRRPRTLAD